MMTAEALHAVWEEVRDGRLVLLDVRTPRAFHHNHIPGAVSAPFQLEGFGAEVQSFLARKGSPAFALLAENQVVLEAAERALLEEALTPSRTLLAKMAEWEQAGLPSVRVADVPVDHLFNEKNQFVVVDVREPYEWRSGVIPGALTVPMGTIPGKLDALPTDQRYAIVCAHGNRSQAVASFLAEHGYEAVNVAGGMMAWHQAGYPVNDAPRH